MSIAGIRSNRGDNYQTFIAFGWALSLLSDPEFQWLEIDSATHLVDDVVIGKSDGSIICCQCKKNQADFRAWSIADLGDELDKAAQALTTNPQAQVRFYSRSEFGSIAKLWEYCAGYANEKEYHANLTQEHKETDSALASRLGAKSPALTTYEFLRRTSFNISENFDRMDELLFERLRQIASNTINAFNALWTCLDKLGGRMGDGNPSASNQYRLTKDNLREILYQAGSMLVPVMSLEEIRTSFSSTSAIGRSWHRDIAGQQISNPVVNKLIAAIEEGKRAILLTGLPGAGKTCVMLSLQEALEQRARSRADVVPLFIQSREFADLATAQERQAQGLPQQWVEQTARLAEEAHIVVVIDSLDVLSIAREHSVLTYFLAQIDQLLMIPNVSVVTACRDFDRKYDRRINVRKWDCELQCLPLDWDSEIIPLLSKLELDFSTMDATTRELVRNPRELALFVELAQREGSFSVVSSQALAQRYLDTIVLADPGLGLEAMQAIEVVAQEMLRTRTLSIHRQRVGVSQDIQRRLLSLNVLRDTQDGKITFGHQTLLDVLVISGSVRRGITLNEFIQDLAPVPFVRPSIRSFIAQLATGNRREFRKQLRTVLTSNAAFHIRRLIAESFAQQVPMDDDWPLIRDLRDNHREVFQVIYTQASLGAWHHFWFSHLVPMLKDTRDSEGLMAHVHRSAAWKNEDTTGVLAFWMEMLTLEYLDSNRIAEQLVFSLDEIKPENLHLVAPLLERLLDMPRSEHTLLGRTVARCVSAEVVDDGSLWRYIVGGISQDDVMSYHFGDKLHCQPHEFGDKNAKFLQQRMIRSPALLDLAIDAIEEWSRIKSSHNGATRLGLCEGFLRDTSYSDAHSQTDHKHIGSERVLLDAIELAILDHARKHSNWWQKNRERLCSNQEGALCYFVVLAVTHSLAPNLDLIKRLLCDRNILEFCLSFELGTLIQSAFIHLDSGTQDTVMTVIQSLWEELGTEARNDFWVQKKRAEYISTIPCQLRSAEAQAVLDAYERAYGTLIRQPSIDMRGGTVSAPFSFEVFLNASDHGVLQLLAHYTGFRDDQRFEFLVGGEREVGMQLREAASRSPSRFLGLLSNNFYEVSADFRDEIMEGIGTYLAYRFGDLQTNGKWDPIEQPDAATLANHILDELERHFVYWRLNRSAAKALEAWAHVIGDTKNAGRLVFLAIGFAALDEKSTIRGNSVDLITTGINMTSGNVAEALMILTTNLQEHSVSLPELLSPTLYRFSNNEHPAIRALILRRLPYVQYQNPELGWELFRRAMQDSEGLWASAEKCLYHAYHNNFERVEPLLERIPHEGKNEDMETWGRISALSALAGHVHFNELLKKLDSLNIVEAWQGAAGVWSHPENIKRHREQCLAGIEGGLKSGNHAMAVARHVERIFRENTPPISIPIELIQLCFSVFENDSEDSHHRLFGFDEWLNATSQRDPELALAAAEIYFFYVKQAKPYLYDHENRLVQLMTRLFAEAEEREESDKGAMLNRVVVLQDLLLSLGLSSVNDWLKAAERP